MPSLRIERSILTAHFACDLAACKGACCTFPGGSGPPVTEDEIPLIEKAWEAVRDMLPPVHRREGDEFGLIVDDGEELTIRCHDERACVFVMYDGDVAVCSIQKLHQLGKFSWPKPLSCHLFPIRVRGRRRDQLHFEHFSECAPAITAGEREQTGLVDFLASALVRAFGVDFTRALQERSRDARGVSAEGDRR